MRHRKKRSRLSMRGSQRKAFLRNTVKNLLKYQRIKLGLARAKEVRRLAERLITLAKTDTVNARRHAYVLLADRDLVGKLFKETVPLFKNRASGYTRILPLGFRRGDGAQLCFLELTEKKMVEKLPKKKKAKEEKTGGQVAGSKEQVGEKEKPKVTEEAKRAKEEHKKEAKKLETEKMAEKARSEDKKLADKRGFMKNLRGLFRKRGDF